MAVVVIGTDVGRGATTISGYIVQSYTDGDVEFTSQDIHDETNQLVTRLVFQKMAKITLVMIPLAATNPKADFPKGEMSTHATTPDLQAYFVEDMQLVETGEADQVTVTLILLGIT